MAVDCWLFSAPSLCIVLLVAISRGLARSAVSLFSAALDYRTSCLNIEFPPRILLSLSILPRSRDSDKWSPKIEKFHFRYDTNSLSVRSERKKTNTHVSYQIDEMNAVTIQRQDMITTLFLAVFGYALHGEETRAKERPFGQYF